MITVVIMSRKVSVQYILEALENDSSDCERYWDSGDFITKLLEDRCDTEPNSSEKINYCELFPLAISVE